MDPYAPIENDDLIDQNYSLINDTSFSVTFHNGYGFRTLMEFVRTIESECEIIFDAEGIRFSKSDIDKTIMIDVIIAGEELVDYKYTSSEDEYTMLLKLSIFCPNIKQASKKKAIRMFKKTGSKESYFQILGTYKDKKMDDDDREVPTLNLSQIKIITPPPENYYTEDPISIIPINSFSTDCKDYSNNQYDSVDICISSSLVKMVGKYDNIESDVDDNKLHIKPMIKRYYSKLYTELSEEEKNTMDIENMYTINIPINRIKSFSKLAIASENGVIKFYRPTDDIIKISKEKEKVVPIKIVCSLSNYGIAQIYIS